jgi:hypothetical protein
LIGARDAFRQFCGVLGFLTGQTMDAINQHVRWLAVHPQHTWTINEVRRKERKQKEKNRRRNRRRR